MLLCRRVTKGITHLVVVVLATLALPAKAVGATSSAASSPVRFPTTSHLYAAKDEQRQPQQHNLRHLQDNSFNNNDESAIDSHDAICTAIVTRFLYRNNEKLMSQHPCNTCVRTDVDHTVFRVECIYDYCPYCDEVTGQCAIRHDVHYFLTTPDADPDFLVPLNATHCRDLYQLVNTTTTTEDDANSTTTDADSAAAESPFFTSTEEIRAAVDSIGNHNNNNEQQEEDSNTPAMTAIAMNTSFCMVNIRHQDSFVRDDYSCQIYVASNTTTAADFQDCKSCQPTVCDNSDLRTSYDCTNVPQGGQSNYCGVEFGPNIDTLEHYTAEGSNLDVDRTSPFASAMYDFSSCEAEPATVAPETTAPDTANTIFVGSDDFVAETDIDFDDDNGIADETVDDSNSTNATTTTTTLPPLTETYTTTTTKDVYNNVTVINSISLSFNGSIVGVASWSQYLRWETDTESNEIVSQEMVVDSHVQVHQRSNASSTTWDSYGSPILVEYRRDWRPTDHSDVAMAMTSNGQNIVIGKNNDWDVHVRAYNGWPPMGNHPSNFRFRVDQRLAITNGNLPTMTSSSFASAASATTTVARVNRPDRNSFHTMKTVPMVEVFDLVVKNTDNQTGGMWTPRPTTPNDYATTERVNMSDVSLSADGNMYAAGATGIPSVFVKQWTPRSTVVTTVSAPIMGGNETVTTAEWRDVADGGGIWVQVGKTLMAEDRVNSAQEGFGYRVALSADGTRLAVGGYTFARFFEYDDKTSGWIQRGRDVEYPQGFQGELCVASSSGNVVAIGQENFGVNNTGRVTVYKWDDSDQDWRYHGVVNGMAQEDHFGRLCSLSGDGAVVAAAGSIQSDSRIGGGYVQVMAVADVTLSGNTEDEEPPTSYLNATNETLISTNETLIPTLAPTVSPTVSQAPSVSAAGRLDSHGVDDIALSGDGSKVAVAQWMLSTNPSFTSQLGLATINEKNETGNSWSLVSESNPSSRILQTNDGFFSGDVSRLNLDMTPDGLIVMYDSYFDHLVYNVSESAFAQIGDELPWNTGFSHSVLSDDGKTLASLLVGDNETQVSVYDLVFSSRRSEWRWRHQATTVWDFVVDPSGISLSADGQTYAVGANGFSFVQVNAWNEENTTFYQVGQNLTATDRVDGDSFGLHVFLSSDATKLFVSALTFARVYQLNNETEWERMGSDIDFPEMVDGSFCVGNSSTFAVGQPGIGPNETGRVSVYEWMEEEQDWLLIGIEPGAAPGDKFGNVCAFSADGTTVAAAGMAEANSRVGGFVECFKVEDVRGILPIEETEAPETIMVSTTNPTEAATEAATLSPTDAATDGTTFEASLAATLVETAATTAELIDTDANFDTTAGIISSSVPESASPSAALSLRASDAPSEVPLVTLSDNTENEVPDSTNNEDNEELTPESVTVSSVSSSPRRFDFGWTWSLVSIALLKWLLVDLR